MNVETYMKHWRGNKVWTHSEWPKHQERFRIIGSYLEGETFIDVGCAYGHSTKHLMKFKTGEWSGLDFSHTAINEARRLFKNIIFYYAEDFNLLPVCGHFDSVVCSEVIEHIEDEKTLIKGLLEITKRILVITTPCVRVSDPGHLRLYDDRMLAELFYGLNYKLNKIHPFFYIVIRNE